MGVQDIRGEDIDGVALVGFRLNPDKEQPEAYTLLTYGADDIALNVNGDLIFFTSRSQINRAFSLFSVAIQEKASVPSELGVLCDVPYALYIIAHEDTDEEAVVLNWMNTMFDLLRAARIQLSTIRKRTLFALADHLTFSSSLEEFFSDKKTSRSEIIDFMTWCIGAIVIRIKFLDRDGSEMK